MPWIYMPMNCRSFGFPTPVVWSRWCKGDDASTLQHTQRETHTTAFDASGGELYLVEEGKAAEARKRSLRPCFTHTRRAQAGLAAAAERDDEVAAAGAMV